MLKYSLKYLLFFESLNIPEFSTQFRGNFSATSFLMQASSVSQDEFEFDFFLKLRTLPKRYDTSTFDSNFSQRK